MIQENKMGTHYFKDFKLLSNLIWREDYRDRLPLKENTKY